LMFFVRYGGLLTCVRDCGKQRFWWPSPEPFGP
jgi:hypothetical protein